MTIAQTYAGCDVSKRTLDLCIADGQGAPLHRARFANRIDGITDLLRLLQVHSVQLLVFEPSGGYEITLMHAHSSGAPEN